MGALLGASRLGNVTNSIVMPRLVKSLGVVPATFFVTAVAMGVTALSSFSLMSTLAVYTKDKARPSLIASLRQFPLTYWQLLAICALGSGGINTFTNSAQRYLAARFFDGDQSAAGAKVR